MAEQNKISIKNKRATFDYEILEEWVAGIVLTGTEIKSVRMGKASLVDCYCFLHRGELLVHGMNIAEYHWGTYNNHSRCGIGSCCSTAGRSTRSSVRCRTRG